ncbi:MAG: hypothetical protein JXA33_24895 [Anaerolineae bacterium]|nr:hypothetical protein [Anaerolineae bacterium]
MKVKEVRELARQWVEAESANIPQFMGAFLTGSINWLADDMVWPATSDVDITLVVEGDAPHNRWRPAYQGLVLDPSFKSLEELRSAEQVLGTYYLAGHFVSPTSILADPSGHLTHLQSQVAKDYAQRRWVRCRCEQAWQLAEACIADMVSPNPPEERAIYLMLTVVFTGQILALADLRNPTFRKSSVLAREVLSSIGQVELHEGLLELLGSAPLRRGDVEYLFQELTEAFDRATTVFQTPCWDDYMVTPVSRPNFIDGAWELIDAGFHREAMSWMLMIRTVCQRIFENDAADNEKAAFRKRYEAMLQALGLHSLPDYQQRAKQAHMMLSEVMSVAETVMMQNAQILDG